MIARALWNKGVGEFIGASREFDDGPVDVRFVLAGDGEPGNPWNVPADYLRRSESRRFRWLGWRPDVRELLAASDISVLLTWDREGVPRSALEAMAWASPWWSPTSPAAGRWSTPAATASWWSREAWLGWSRRCAG